MLIIPNNLKFVTSWGRAMISLRSRTDLNGRNADSIGKLSSEDLSSKERLCSASAYDTRKEIAAILKSFSLCFRVAALSSLNTTRAQQDFNNGHFTRIPHSWDEAGFSVETAPVGCSLLTTVFSHPNHIRNTISTAGAGARAGLHERGGQPFPLSLLPIIPRSRRTAIKGSLLRAQYTAQHLHYAGIRFFRQKNPVGACGRAGSILLYVNI